MNLIKSTNFILGRIMMSRLTKRQQALASSVYHMVFSMADDRGQHSSMKDDLVSAGMLAVCNAARKYKQDRGAFSTLAHAAILNAMRGVINEHYDRKHQKRGHCNGKTSPELSRFPLVQYNEYDDAPPEPYEENILQCRIDDRDQMAVMIDNALREYAVTELEVQWLVERYMHGRSTKDIGEEYCCSRHEVFFHIKQALRRIREVNGIPEARKAERCAAPAC